MPNKMETSVLDYVGGNEAPDHRPPMNLHQFNDPGFQLQSSLFRTNYMFCELLSSSISLNYKRQSPEAKQVTGQGDRNDWDYIPNMPFLCDV